MRSELVEILAVFDKSYSDFEQFYIYELMVIERDARRFVSEAICVEQQMQLMEAKLVQRGENVYENEAYNELRSEFIGLLAQINAVTNVNGKGRDDLTDIQILRAAENIGKELKPGQAKAIQVLADKIRQSLRCFRVLLRRYSENLDAVDPQLRNNKELLELVEIYENSWALGKEQLLDEQLKQQLISFCLQIEQVCSRNETFREQVESFEADIFLSIPSLVVLWSVNQSERTEVFRQLCCRFCDSIDHDELSTQFKALAVNKREASTALEQFVINDDLSSLHPNLREFGQKLRHHGMQLSRNDAQSFNQFITAALGA